MAMEPWFLYPPEANFRRLSGTSAGARSAATTYYAMSQAIRADGDEQYRNAQQLAEANVGAVGEQVLRVGSMQQRYSDTLATQAWAAGTQLKDVAERADATRAWRVPMSIIENNKLWQKEAMKQMWWNPAAPAVLAAAVAAYGAMWTINATTGTVFDVAATRNALPVEVMSPPMSVSYGTNLEKATVGTAQAIDRSQLHGLLSQITRPEQASKVLTPPAAQTMSPAAQNALANSEYVAQQMIRPIDGVRGGGLGSGETMPYVGANPTIAYPRGGVPTLTTQTTRGDLATAQRADMTAFSPMATTPGLRPGMSTGMGTGAGASGMRIPGFSGLGTGAGGAHATGTSPASALRAGMASKAGSIGGMRAGGAGAGALGGRVGPAFTGVSPADKTLGAMQKAGSVGATTGSGAGTVGTQGRGVGMGPMGMGRGQQQQRSQSSGTHAYIAQEVSFTSLKDEEELARRRDDMFK